LNRETLLTLYDRFTGLVEKLPGGLQKPILRELVPIRELFLEQRPARLLLLGPAGQSVPEFLHRSAGLQVETGDADHGWRLYHVPGRGSVQILDGRSDVPESVLPAACAHLRPDAAVLLWEADASAPAADEAARRLAGVGPEVPVIGVAFGGDPARARLAALFASEREFALRKSSVCSPEAGDAVAEILCAALPNNARLEFARLTVAKKAQAEIAGSLLKSFTAVCGVIGLQPIPLADMPVLTSLQTLMVSLVIYTTGKPANPRLFAEFVGALGINIGAGLLFREGARALIRIVPFWGNAVSGMIAGAGTYAIGRAAIAYFIEERPVHETKQLFHRLLPSWDAFKTKRGARLPKNAVTPPPLPQPGAGEE
jgi:uncharacterized protein (DUF697 family)